MGGWFSVRGRAGELRFTGTPPVWRRPYVRVRWEGPSSARRAQSPSRTWRRFCKQLDGTGDTRSGARTMIGSGYERRTDGMGTADAPAGPRVKVYDLAKDLNVSKDDL